MQLFYRKYGQGKPIFILHGLFGQSDNWQTMAKKLGVKDFAVYTVDLRNHGLSPHSVEFNYKIMSTDLNELISNEGLNKVTLLGHSMGGKTALQFVNDYPEKIDKLIVVDIAPKYYPAHHTQVTDALKAIDLNIVKTRKAAEDILSQYISDFGINQFILKNLYWKTDTQLDWRFNLSSITKNIERVGDEIKLNSVYSNKDFHSLFIRGANSNYISETDISTIRIHFPDAQFTSIEGASHWPHAESPIEFFEVISGFLNR